MKRKYIWKREKLESLLGDYDRLRKSVYPSIITFEDVKDFYYQHIEESDSIQLLKVKEILYNPTEEFMKFVTLHILKINVSYNIILHLGSDLYKFTKIMEAWDTMKLDKFKWMANAANVLIMFQIYSITGKYCWEVGRMTVPAHKTATRDVEGVIYHFKCKTTEKGYIGQTIQNPQKRKRQHERVDSKCTLLKQAIDKYGVNDFEFHVLLMCKKQELDKNECYYIQKYNTLVPNGYNITAGNFTFSDHDEYTICNVINPLVEMGIKLNVYSSLLSIENNTETMTDKMLRREVKKNHPDKTAENVEKCYSLVNEINRRKMLT